MLRRPARKLKEDKEAHDDEKKTFIILCGGDVDILK